MIIDINRYKREAKIRHIKDIVGKDINKLRIELSHKFLSAECKENITEEYIRDFMTRIEKMCVKTEEEKSVFQAHKENFECFLQTGDLKRPLDLNTDESLLYWGAALTLLAVHPEMQQKWERKNQADSISKTVLWRRIAASGRMQSDLSMHAWHISRLVDNPDAKIVYGDLGYPNIGYCFSPKENMIIDDMLWTMITGPETAALAINHEIAHSQGTQNMRSPKMQELSDEQDEIVKKIKEASAKGDKEEVARLNKIAVRKKIEYEYRFMFLDELENMFANRYAVAFGGEFDGAKANELETVINLGEKYSYPTDKSEMEKKLKENVRERILHVKALARNTFFAGNGIVNGYNYDDFIMLNSEWNSVGLYPELLTGVDKDGVAMTNKECCEKLCEMCAKFEQQPSAALKSFSAARYSKVMTSMSDKRAKMVDEFFDIFVAPHMEELYKEAEKDLNKFMDDMMQNRQQSGGQSGNQQQEQNGEKQDGKSSGQSGGQQQEQDGEKQDGQSGGQSGNQQQEQDGEKQDGKSGGQSGNQQQEQNGEKQEGKSSGQSGNQQQEQDGEKQDGQSGGQSGNQQRQGKDWENGEDNPDSLRMTEDDSYGKEISKEKLQELLDKVENIDELKKQFEANHKDEIEEREKFDKEQKEKNKKEDKNAEFDREKLDSLEVDMTRPRQMSLDDYTYTPSSAMRELLKGDRNEYHKYIAQFSKEIAAAKKIIKQIITARKLASVRRGKGVKRQEYTLEPVQGAHTLDRKKREDFYKRVITRDPSINIDDLKHYKTKYKRSEDELIDKEEISSSNFGILIDSSGSMQGAPFEKALAISCILYEASREFKELGVYIYLMGEKEPFTVATPNDSTQEIAKRISMILNGRGQCADRILPAMHQYLVDVSGDMHKKADKKSGFTHIFSLTDGWNQEYYSNGFDNERINSALEKMVRENEHITYDTFVIDSSWNSRAPIIAVADDLKAKGINRMDYVEIPNNVSGKELGEQLSQKIYELMMKRIKHNEVIMPETNKVKKKLIDDNIRTLESADASLKRSKKTTTKTMGGSGGRE